jgi:hypothetical protein
MVWSTTGLHAAANRWQPGLYFQQRLRVITLLNVCGPARSAPIHAVQRRVYGAETLIRRRALAPKPPLRKEVVMMRLLTALVLTRACHRLRDLGEDHRPSRTSRWPSWPWPLALDLYGTDYPTPDGTCIRDYVHVVDLARAHLLALARCEDLPAGQAGGGAVYNLGNGRGFSNRQVMEAAQRVTGRPIAVRECPRRPGDPVSLIAAASGRAGSWMGTPPRLEDIIDSAWRWHQRTQGYPVILHRRTSLVVASR